MMPKDREILKGLDGLLESAGNRFGPILLDELQERLSETVKIFDLELKESLESSFKKYHTQHDQLKVLIHQNYNPIKKHSKITQYKYRQNILFLYGHFNSNIPTTRTCTVL
jgi:hypothetical protein